MKTLFLLTITLTCSFGAEPVVRVQSFPHTAQSAPIGPGLVQGIVGIGIEAPGFILTPCIGCYGAPAGALVLPPPFQVIRATEEEQGLLVYYYGTVETGDLGGTGTVSFVITEATTGKVVQSFSGASLVLAANSTNLIIVDSGGVTDSDRYNGIDILTITTTLGKATVQGSVEMFMPY
jgi:hypothetical protein